MAALPVSHGKMTFEICLPHLVGFILLKALHWLCCLAGLLADHAVSFENIVYCFYTGNICISLILKNSMNFQRSDRRMCLTVIHD